MHEGGRIELDRESERAHSDWDREERKSGPGQDRVNACGAKRALKRGTSKQAQPLRGEAGAEPGNHIASEAERGEHPSTNGHVSCQWPGIYGPWGRAEICSEVEKLSEEEQGKPERYGGCG